MLPPAPHCYPESRPKNEAHVTHQKCLCLSVLQPWPHSVRTHRTSLQDASLNYDHRTKSTRSSINKEVRVSLPGPNLHDRTLLTTQPGANRLLAELVNVDLKWPKPIRKTSVFGVHLA